MGKIVSGIFGGGRTGNSVADNAAAVRESAKVNQINEVSPYGQIRYTGAIGSPDRTVTTTLRPGLQRALDQYTTGIKSLATDARYRSGQMDPRNITAGGLPNFVNTVGRTPVQSQLDFSGAPGLADYGDASGEVERATFDRSRDLRRLGEAERQRDMLTALDQRGVDLGSEQGQRIMAHREREAAQQDRIAANDAVLAGRNEAERLFRSSLAGRQQDVGETMTGGQFANQAALQEFGMGMEQGRFRNDARARQLAERFGIQSHNMDQVMQLMNAQNVIRGAAPQTNRAQYNVAPPTEQKQQSPIWDLAGTLGAAWIMSSKKLKDEVGDVDSEAALKAVVSTPIKAWRYKGDDETHIGPYAEDAHANGLSSRDNMINVGDVASTGLAALKALAKRVEVLEAA